MRFLGWLTSVPPFWDRQDVKRGRQEMFRVTAFPVLGLSVSLKPRHLPLLLIAGLL
jgi:hypothetical protein